MLVNNILDRLKKYKFFQTIDPETFSQMKRYVITGFTGFAIEYALFFSFYYYIFKRFFPAGYPLAKALRKTALIMIWKPIHTAICLRMQLPMWLFFGLIFLSTGFGHSNQKSIFLNSWDSMLSYLFLIYLPPARYYGF